MFGFPININEFGDSPVKLTNSANSGFPKPNIGETFYSIKSGIWGDASVWQTASGRVGLFPTANDTVYIRSHHTISITTGNITTIACNNLIVNGTLNMVNFGTTGLNIYNGIIVNGQLNLQSGVENVKLYGNNNYIPKNKCSIAVSATFVYLGKDQFILDLDYAQLEIRGSGTLCTTSDLTCSGLYLITFCTLELGSYNLTCNGLFVTSANGAILSKNGGGNILFIGNANFSFGGFVLADNVNVEFRGGFASGTPNNIRTGLSTWNFTTNNQNITFSNGTTIIDALVNINNGITITVAAAGTGAVQFNNIINGLGGTSNLINRRTVFFGTQNAAENSMTTGTFDISTFANTVGYTGNYSATIPSALTTFSSLIISGTGTKTLGANTTLNGDLLVSSGTFQLGTFDLTVTGTSTTSGASGFISKNSTGNILFIGAVSLGNGSGAGGFNFSGNPNIEFRNGLSTNNNGTMVMGSGNYTFTTNNQTIFQFPGGTYIFPNATIVGAITLTWVGGSVNVGNGANSGFITNPIGTVAGSKLVNNGSIFFNGLPSGVMSVGVFDITTYTNNVTYNYNGNDTLPFTTYSTLTIGGSGTKTLNGNTTINGVGTIYGNSAVFECSVYNLTVNGTLGGQPSTSGATISKTGSGSLLFVGAVSTNTINWVLTGNPTIECRGGLRLINVNTGIHNMGNGTITFSTNNQTLNANNALTFNNPITISGAITLTVEGFAAAGNFTFTEVINGNNASSTLRVGTTSPTINYQSATQPMATGILNTSTNLNTWIYGLNNQNIKGSPTISPKQVYRNLTLNGTGTKTLQGYVSVLNTYTLTAPATLANNGFTLTNP